MLHALPYAKRLELERRQPAELRAALAGLALLCVGVGKLRTGGLAVGHLVFLPGAKPRCADGPHFSISHTRGRVACAISEAVDPGVDIESVADQATAGLIQTLRRWTATEAALKAAGLGLRDTSRVRLDTNLSHAEIGSTRYALREPQLAAGYLCHVAAAEVVPALEISEVDLDSTATSLAVERSLGFAAQAK